MLIRLPRFNRIPTVVPITLTARDRDIIRHVDRHRFLRSNQIVALIGGSEQQVVRRLQLLFHHGYLERPRAQLQYFERGGSKAIVYGLGNKGGEVLRKEFGITVDSHAWNQKNNEVGRVFLEHAVLVSDVMVRLELACQKRGNVRIVYEEDLGLKNQPKPFRWWVKTPHGRKLGIMPDRVFALEYVNLRGELQRAHFFLEADRGTMPIIRSNPALSSFQRKLIGYEGTWTNKVHERHLGISHFRVLTVTTVPGRVQSLLAACSQLKRGHGLFLFADHSVLEKDLLSAVWTSGKTGQASTLLNEPAPSGV